MNRTIEKVDEHIASLPEEMREIASELRQIILDASPELVEEYKWSMPNYSSSGLVCYLQTAKKHVKLGFHKGHELQEGIGHDILEGDGKMMRYITVKKVEDIKPETFASLIRAAIELNKRK